MENKIDISKLLEDCPSGMELNCTTWENVTFEKVVGGAIYIKRNTKSPSFDNIVILNKYGCATNYEDEKCRIFPKGKTDWKGFHGPFKDGDILATNDGKFVAIIKKNGGKYYCSCYTNGNYFVTDYSGWFDRFATEEEKQKLFDTIKANGYKWNPETKVLEKLPKFKVGDRIKHKGNSGLYCTLGEYSEGISAYRTNIGVSLTHEDLENWELFPVSNGFDINTLRPFKSKVLVRDNNHCIWEVDLFGRYSPNDSSGEYVTLGGIKWKQCIPYEGNEHLHGTTINCSDYFKTWKDE